jgi:hypothetical protein
MDATPSNHLEIAKLGVQLVSPTVAIFIALWLRPFLGRVERRLWTHQKLLEKRLALFESVAAAIDNIHCFFTYQADWNQLDPGDIVEKGKATAAAIRINRALFSEAFLDAYDAFKKGCFDDSDSGGRLRLRTSIADRRSPSGKAAKDMAAHFVDDSAKCESRDEIGRRYQALITAFADEIGIPRAGARH